MRNTNTMTMVNGDKYGFVGHNTSGNISYKTSGDSWKEIYDNLVDMGVISHVDYCPDIKYILEQINKTEEDFFDEAAEDYDWDEIYKSYSLSDEDYLNIINGENGNAYYQEYYVWNDDKKTWDEYDR